MGKSCLRDATAGISPASAVPNPALEASSPALIDACNPSNPCGTLDSGSALLPGVEVPEFEDRWEASSGKTPEMPAFIILLLLPKGLG